MSENDDWFQDFIFNFHSLENKENLAADATKDIRDLKNSFKLVQEFVGVEVYAVVSSLQPCFNSSFEISCLRGTPLSYSFYNIPQDIYIVNGIEYRYLGSVPVNYRLEIQDAFQFYVNIPLPEKVILRYLKEDKLELLKHLKKVYPKESHKIEFLQMLKVSFDE